ncbi:MAG: beta-N-acetylhexosaminidase [Bdellovibrio bacteriovorus]
MSLGPVMVDLEGVAPTAAERELLRHPAVGGVILFARNYVSPEQLAELTAAIHGLREPRLLIGVDQEGGRVQRFRSGFTRLPAAGCYGALYGEDPGRARRACAAVAWLMAAELRALGVDFSFAPVLDLDRGHSRVIGDRGFGSGVEVVVDLATAWVAGARRAGMASVGKHFPGHGGVVGDSHTELPVDDRDWSTIAAEDLVPFERLIRQGLEAVMPAHVVYPRIAAEPAGFSPHWLQEVLRGALGFQGVIFSDDLNMAAAQAGGGYAERAAAALEAGCDMLLICNNRPAALEILEALRDHSDPAAQLRLLRMHGRGHPRSEGLREDPQWQAAIHHVALLEASPSLDLPLVDPTTPGVPA